MNLLPTARVSLALLGVFAVLLDPSATYAETPEETPASPPEDIEVEDIEVEDIEVEDIEVEDEGGEGALRFDGPIVLPDVMVRYRLDEIARVGGSAHLLTEADLERFENDDPHAVLLKVPGIYLRQEDGYGLRPNIGLRGASSDRSKKVTLMEDGILFGPAPYSAPAAYYFPLMTRMQGVEVFKGPAAIRYGPNTIGGAVNLVTRAIPQRAEGMLDLAYGMTNYTKLHGHYGASNKWSGMLFEGVVLSSDGFKELDGGGNTGFLKGEFMLKGMVQSDPLASVHHRGDVKVGLSLETSNETYLGLTDDDFEANPYRRYRASALDQMDNDRLQLQAAYALQVGDTARLSVTGYRHTYFRAWRKAARFRNGPSLSDILKAPDAGERAVYYAILTGAEDAYTDGEALMLGTNARKYLSQGLAVESSVQYDGEFTNHELTLGLRLHQDQIERNHTEEAYWMEGAELVHAGESVLTSTKNIGKTTAIAGHLIYGLSGGGLSISPGFRVEYIDSGMNDVLQGSRADNSQLVFLPGLGAHLALFEGVGLIAGVHKGFSPVAPGQSEEVEPETSMNFELGVRYTRPATSTLVEVIGFASDYTNLVGECTFSSGCSAEQLDRQSNAGEVFVSGLEVVAGHRYQLGAGILLPLRFAYTYTRTRFLGDFESDNPQFGQVKEGDELPYVPRHQWTLQAGLEGRHWGLNAHATLVDEMRETAGQGDAESSDFTASLFLVDVVARVEAVPGIEAYLKLENLLMSEGIVSRRPYGARPNKPFSLSVGLKLQL